MQQLQLPLVYSRTELLRQLRDASNLTHTLQAQKAIDSTSIGMAGSKMSIFPPVGVCLNIDATSLSLSSRVISESFLRGWTAESITALKGAIEAARGLIGSQLHIVGKIYTTRTRWTGTSGAIGSGRNESCTQQLEVDTRRELKRITIHSYNITVRFCITWQNHPFYFEPFSQGNPKFHFID